MPFANLTWRLTASGLQDELVLADALAWLTGNSESIELERTRSYHGSPLYMISSRLTRRGDIRRAMMNLGPNLLNTLLMQLEERFHEDNCLYFRLDIDMLVSGIISLSGQGPSTVKARLKLRAFPGQDPLQVARDALESLVEKASVPPLPMEEE